MIGNVPTNKNQLIQSLRSMNIKKFALLQDIQLKDVKTKTIPNINDRDVVSVIFIKE